MGDATATSGTRSGRLLGFVRGRSRTEKVGAAGAVALLATAPFGGLSAVQPAPPEPIDLGEAFMVGPFEVTVEKVRSLPDLGTVAEPEIEGNRLLVIVAEVTNTDPIPREPSDLRNALSVSGAGVLVPYGEDAVQLRDMVIIEDGTWFSTVNPDITHRVAMYFEQGPGVAGPVTLAVDELVYTEESSLTLAADYWRDTDEVVLRGELPVEVEP